MPLTAKGETILASLQKQYGSDKGESVLHAGKNAGTFTGIDAIADASKTSNVKEGPGSWSVKLSKDGESKRVKVSASDAGAAAEAAESDNPGWRASRQHTIRADDLSISQRELEDEKRFLERYKDLKAVGDACSAIADQVEQLHRRMDAIDARRARGDASNVWANEEQRLYIDKNEKGKHQVVANGVIVKEFDDFDQARAYVRRQYRV